MYIRYYHQNKPRQKRWSGHCVLVDLKTKTNLDATTFLSGVYLQCQSEERLPMVTVRAECIVSCDANRRLALPQQCLLSLNPWLTCKHTRQCPTCFDVHAIEKVWQPPNKNYKLFANNPDSRHRLL